MKTSWTCLLALFLVACVSSPSYVERRADSLVKVCSAGLSNQTAARAGALVASGQGTLSIELVREIRGAIFADPNLSGVERVSVYERYLECVRDGGVEVQKEDADSSIQRVQFSNDFRPAGLFSSYDFIAKFNRAYKNIGDRTIECRLRVRGVLMRRSSRSVDDVGQVHHRSFVVRSGQFHKVEGEVGVNGFSDERYVVSTDDRLECWYQ